MAAFGCSGDVPMAETTGEGARRQQTSEVCDLKPAGPQVGGGEANEADVDSKGLKRTAHAISFAFNMMSAFRANELRGVNSFVM